MDNSQVQSDIDSKQFRFMQDFFLTQPMKRLDESAMSARAKSIYLQKPSAMSHRSNKSSIANFDTTPMTKRTRSVVIDQKSVASRIEQGSSCKMRPKSSKPRFAISKPKYFTPSQGATHVSLEQQCKRIDPQFVLKDFLSVDFPERVKYRQSRLLHSNAERARDDLRMNEMLKMEKRCISQLKDKEKLYKPHDRIIRKLRRIYQNKPKGDTELSTEGNQALEKQIAEKKVEVAKPPDAGERALRWQMMRRQRVTVEDVQAVLQMYEGGLLNSDRKERERQRQAETQRRKQLIEQLKHDNSPMSLILERFGGLVEHYYANFSVPMKQIVDFYQPEKVEDDNLQTYESLSQDEQFARQQKRIKLYLDKRDTYSARHPSRTPNIKHVKKHYKHLFNLLQETGQGVKENIDLADKARKSDLFESVSQRFYQEIEVKSKLF